MENIEPKETGDWGLGTEDWGQGGQGDKGTRRQGDKETRGQGDKGNKQYPIPNPQYPIPITPYPQRGPHLPQSPIPKTQLVLHLIPIFGFFPSLWTLYRRQGSREQLAISRLSITLALTWLFSYLLLATGAATSDFFALRLFILNTFLTSGYFLGSVWLIFRLFKGKSGRLPGFSNFAERVLGKYLS